MSKSQFTEQPTVTARALRNQYQIIPHKSDSYPYMPQYRTRKLWWWSKWKNLIWGGVSSEAEARKLIAIHRRFDGGVRIP